jgi:hypothetical protein
LLLPLPFLLLFDCHPSPKAEDLLFPLPFAFLVVFPEGHPLLSLPLPCHSERSEEPPTLALRHPVDNSCPALPKAQSAARRAKRLILLPLFLLLFFFCVFSPEIACQGPK